MQEHSSYQGGWGETRMHTVGAEPRTISILALLLGRWTIDRE
jgi:hypothetical protein